MCPLRSRLFGSLASAFARGRSISSWWLSNTYLWCWSPAANDCNKGKHHSSVTICFSMAFKARMLTATGWFVTISLPQHQSRFVAECGFMLSKQPDVNCLGPGLRQRKRLGAFQKFVWSSPGRRFEALSCVSWCWCGKWLRRATTIARTLPKESWKVEIWFLALRSHKMFRSCFVVGLAKEGLLLVYYFAFFLSHSLPLDYWHDPKLYLYISLFGHLWATSFAEWRHQTWTLLNEIDSAGKSSKIWETHASKEEYSSLACEDYLATRNSSLRYLTSGSAAQPYVPSKVEVKPPKTKVRHSKSKSGQGSNSVSREWSETLCDSSGDLVGLWLFWPACSGAGTLVAGTWKT